MTQANDDRHDTGKQLNKVFYRGINTKSRVGAIYPRVSDDYLDPLAFEPTSLLGVPNLMEAYRAGEVGVQMNVTKALPTEYTFSCSSGSSVAGSLP